MMEHEQYIQVLKVSAMLPVPSIITSSQVPTITCVPLAMSQAHTDGHGHFKSSLVKLIQNFQTQALWSLQLSLRVHLICGPICQHWALDK